MWIRGWEYLGYTRRCSFREEWEVDCGDIFIVFYKFFSVYGEYLVIGSFF